MGEAGTATAGRAAGTVQVMAPVPTPYIRDRTRRVYDDVVPPIRGMPTFRQIQEAHDAYQSERARMVHIGDDPRVVRQAARAIAGIRRLCRMAYGRSPATGTYDGVAAQAAFMAEGPRQDELGREQHEGPLDVAYDVVISAVLEMLAAGADRRLGAEVEAIDGAAYRVYFANWSANRDQHGEVPC